MGNKKSYFKRCIASRLKNDDFITVFENHLKCLRFFWSGARNRRRPRNRNASLSLKLKMELLGEFFWDFFYLLCHFSNENCLRGNSISADVILLLVLVIHGPPGSFVKCAEPKIRNCWRLASLTRGLSMLSTISIASRRRRSRRAASVTFLECIEACFSSQREKYT